MEAHYDKWIASTALERGGFWLTYISVLPASVKGWRISMIPTNMHWFCIHIMKHISLQELKQIIQNFKEYRVKHKYLVKKTVFGKKCISILISISDSDIYVSFQNSICLLLHIFSAFKIILCVLFQNYSFIYYFQDFLFKICCILIFYYISIYYSIIYTYRLTRLFSYLVKDSNVLQHKTTYYLY